MVDAAVRSSVRETVFRLELVNRINVTAHERIDREGLVYLALVGQFEFMASEDRVGRQANADHLRRLSSCRDAAFAGVDELLMWEDARKLVERRFLDGRVALFPAVVEAWATTVHESQMLAAMADRMAELDGAAPVTQPSADAVAERVASLAADLVEPARSSALEKLDEGRKALAIATDWLRAKRDAATQRPT